MSWNNDNAALTHNDRAQREAIHMASRPIWERFNRGEITRDQLDEGLKAIGARSSFE